MDTADRLRALSSVIRRIDEFQFADGNTTPGATVIDELTGIVGVEILPLRRKILRPDDLLSLDVTFQNMRLTGVGTRRRLVRRVASRPSLLVVRFQGQSIGERDYDDEDDGVPPTPAEAVQTPVPARLSSPSQLVFRMPADATGLDFTVDAILEACRLWPMALDPIARLDRAVIAPGLAPDIGDVVAVRPDEVDPSIVDTFEPFVDAAAATLRDAGQDRLCAAVIGAAKRSGATLAGAVAIGRKPDEGAKREMGAAFEMALKAAPRANAGAKATARLLFEAEVASTVLRDSRVTESAVATDVLADIGTLVQIALAPHAPSRQVTAIEAPYRIIFSPLSNTAWSHARAPVTKTGRTELWHSRLSRRISGMPNEMVGGSKGVRPFWTPDYGGQFIGQELDAPNADVLKGARPTSKQRSDIVRLTAGYNEQSDGSPYDPRSIPAERVMLSTLGAALNWEGEWNDAPTERPGFLGVDVSSWKHISNWARDNYVKVVEEGFLMPFGHRAAFVSITERKFETMPGGGRGAYLRTKKFVILRERLKRFPVQGQRMNGRDFPLGEVEIQTESTPAITEGELNPGVVGPLVAQAFVPRLGPRDFLFQIRGTDLGGRAFAAAMPLAFVFRSTNQNAAFRDAALQAYNSGLPVPTQRRRIKIGGLEMQYAPIAGPGAEDVLLPTEEIEFAAFDRTGAFNQNQPRFTPAFTGMNVVIPSLKKLAANAGGGSPQPIRFRPDYLQNGFGAPNPAGLFAELVDNLPLNFGNDTENSGAFFEPNTGIEALSAIKGAVADASMVAQGLFDPAEFFKGAKILGSILIEELLNNAVTSILGDDAPEIFNAELESPARIEARLKWDTTIDDSPIPLFVPRAGGQDTAFKIDVLNTVFLNGDPPTTRIESELTNFKVNLFGFIILWFDRLQFLKEPGMKPDVNPDLHPEDAVVFGGPLEFVNKLSDIIPDAGFSDPPVLDISPSGIVAGYDLDIPNVQVGVLALTNMSLGARLRLPFDGDPVSVRFNFAEREDPFNLTISLLGGGGFFAIGLDSGGVREIEAALEFGAAIAFDIGVASGGVYVKAGIYFHWLVEGSEGQVELTGYVEMGGELSVLGLITVSVTFYLALSYHKAGGMAELRGVAKLTIEIEILFFSTSVELQVERRFGGSPADPKFIDFIPDQATWNRYAAAFA